MVVKIEVFALNELGTRIKKLRKEKNMTLAELAGDRLSKGMLSLIENGKAQPSMESLHYIADQLNVDVSVLLNESHIEEIRKLLLEVEKENKIFHGPLDEIESKRKLNLLNKINEVQDKLKGNNYEEVRLLDLKLRLQFLIEQKENPIEEINHVINLYEKIHAYSRMVNCYSFLSSIEFIKHNYEKSLSILEQAEARIKPYVHLIDHLSKLDLHYLLTVLYAAVDDVPNTEKHLHAALEIAHDNKIYYRVDDFYRFMLVQSIGRNDYEKSKYYITKLKQHAEFTEEAISNYAYIFCEANYTNLVEKDYKKTLEIAKKVRNTPPSDLEYLEYLFDFIVVEETYALWALGLYEEAINCSLNFSISPAINHPYDITAMYKCFAVRALCYLEIGDLESAKRDILYAENGVKDFPNTMDKQFITSAYEKIINENK